MYELYLLPMQRLDGLEQNQLTGLFPAAAPKRCQRSRAKDRLLIWLSFVTGGENVSEELLSDWLKEAARAYFNTRGTITSGMRVVANHLNQQILTLAGSLPQSQGKIGAKLNLIVLRDDALYLAHAGAVYTFLLQADRMTPYFSTNSHAQVLGYAEEIQPHFFQTEIQAGDGLLFSPSPAQGWNRQTLTFEKRPSLQSVRRRLLNNTQGNFEALVLQFQSGEKGEFHKMRLETAPEPQPQPEPETQIPTTEAVPEKQSEAVPQTDVPLVVEPETIDLETTPEATPLTAAAEEEPETLAEPLELQEDDADDQSAAPEPAVFIGSPALASSTPLIHAEIEPADAEPVLEKKKKEKKPRITLEERLEKLPLPDFEDTERRFAENWIKLRGLEAKPDFSSATQPPLPKVVDGEEHPDETELQTEEPAPKPAEEPQFKLPISNRVLLFVAIAVPLIVAVIAATVYFQTGVKEQFEANYTMARQISLEALGETDSEIKRTRLENALEYLEKAETFRTNDDSESLRLQIQEALDDVDGVVRLELFNIIDSRLNDSIVISKLLVVSQYDLYALDSSSGQVLHFVYDGQIYELDEAFSCGGSGLEKFVDIAPLSPLNTKKAAILAIDAVGSITYCLKNAQPSNEMLKVPIFGWVNVTEMSMERNTIYTLDQGTRALWQYYGENQNFTNQEPYLFFSQDPPLDLTTVKAMDVYSDTIIFIQDSNKVMTCLAQARTAEDRECFYLPPIDKAGDAIPLQSVDWVDVFAADFPPAYYLLDQSSQTLYQFSVQMKLNKSFRFFTTDGNWLTKQEISAFTVTDQQNILVAFGNEIYLAQIK